MRAVIYLRVSTDEQADTRNGLEAQLDACRTWAGRGGWEAGAPHADEGVSGAALIDKRPGLLDALAELGPGDVLLVAKRDRLGRDPIAVAMIEAAVARKKARVISAAGEGTEGDDPTQVLMRRVIDAFAEYERLLIKARTRAALAAKARRGERTGKVPLGYVLAKGGVKLRADAGEQATIVLIRDLRAGGRSLRAIAAELTRRGIATKEGKGPWAHTAVARVLKRKAAA